MNIDKKKIIPAVLIILFIIASIPITIFLIRQRQEIRKEAAVPEGEATVSLAPTTGTYEVDESFSVSALFNTANIPISAISIRLTYPYSGTTPEVTASGIQINSSLLASDWTCPVKTITPSGGTVKIDIACVNTNVAGFTTSTDTLLASFNLAASQVPDTNPVILTFDSTLSIITKKADGADILLIPTSTGSYTITGGASLSPSPSPSPSPGNGIGGIDTSPSPSPSSDTNGVGGTTASPTPSPSPTTVTSATPSASPEALPEAGFFTPTLLFLTSGGVLLLLTFLLL